MVSKCSTSTNLIFPRKQNKTIGNSFLLSVSELPESEYLSVADATWLALNVVSGGGSATSSQPIGVTKIAKSVIAPLADHNISVFMLSTYQTDFILVSVTDAIESRKYLPYYYIPNLCTVCISTGIKELFFSQLFFSIKTIDTQRIT